MDTKKTRVFAIICLVIIPLLFIIRIVTTTLTMPLVTEFLEKLQTEPNTIENWVAFSETVTKKTGFLSTLNFLLTVPYFVFLIMSIVQAKKIQSNKTPFILLIIGIFSKIVAVVGLILLLVEIKKIEQNPTDRFDTETGQPLIP
ncbi:MAG: hypothetical protein ACOX56_03555 [Acholeplasmataceae bacterium]